MRYSIVVRVYVLCISVIKEQRKLDMHLGPEDLQVLYISLPRMTYLNKYVILQLHLTLLSLGFEFALS